MPVTPDSAPSSAINIRPFFAKEGADPFAGIEWEIRTATIRTKDEIVFQMDGVEVPKTWSQRATDIVASKYFRKAGVPLPGDVGHGAETSVRQLVHRVAYAIAEAGERQGYFDKANGELLYAELVHLLVRQMGAFNSPVWFNVGLSEIYGIKGDPAGNWTCDRTGSAVRADDAYETPQCSACFIRTVEDDIMSIANGIVTEMRLFKWGSGTGTNFSKLRARGEPLSGGGQSSGLMSFLKVYDASAGSIKSGGTTRRAAKIVVLDADHPDIEEFVGWKVREEEKAAALMRAGFSGGMDGEAYSTVSGQNANNSVRVTDEFMRAVESDGKWATRFRVSGKEASVAKARDLMRKIAQATWRCADPGMQFHDTCNKWNTVTAEGEIRASNPCQPDWATVLTPEGIRCLGEIDAGDTIWSGARWTTVTKKWATGVKPVYAFKTRAGVFYGTENHRIVQDGEKVEVGQAETIDVACNTEAGEWLKEQISPDVLHDQDVMDGLVLGDGMVHRASKNLPPLLVVGDGDQDYFQSEIADLFIEDRNATSPRAWAVKTTLQRHEVPKTFDRKVPDRFKYGAGDIVCGFLRGLYSANGSVVASRVTLKAASFAVIEDVQQMLSSLGIRSYYTINKRKLVEFANGVYECRQSYDLNISTDRRQFAAVIGFIQKDKQERLAECCARPTNEKRSKRTYEIVEREFISEEEVFDITVDDDDHTYWTGGLLVSNCAEFSFVDDTACNLASLNLLHFFGEDGQLDIESFQAAVRIFILAQEILVDYASYPTAEIAENSHKLRPLGLGYANLGALLMYLGVPYDSDEGRDICGRLTALMAGTAWLASAEIAKAIGPFPGFAHNRESMLRVGRMHRDAMGESRADPVWSVARLSWDRALALGEKHGFRNSQLTLLAPTGTISFLMDCDTTGIEPGYALVTSKKLAGGGGMKIVNNTVLPALRRLGYDEAALNEIMAHVDEKGTIKGAPYVKPADYRVFSCATGETALTPRAHLKMVAAAQPFLCGAVSKTVNTCESTTVEEIEALFMGAWKLGLKAVAIYRHNSKGVQVLSPVGEETKTGGGPPPRVRERLPKKRYGWTQEALVGGHKIYFRTGEYRGGQLGEIFIDMQKQGATVGALLNTFAIAISLGLQHGVPLEEFCDAFTWTRFQPAGPVRGHEHVKVATSVIDYIFKVLAVEYLGRHDLAHVHPLKQATKPLPKPVASREAQICPQCGGMTQTSGTCAVCLSCGETTGCS